MKPIEQMLWYGLIINWTLHDKIDSRFQEAMCKLSSQQQDLLAKMKKIVKTSWAKLEIGTQSLPLGTKLPHNHPLQEQALCHNMALSLIQYILTGTPGEFPSAKELLNDATKAGVLQRGDILIPNPENN